MRTFEICNRGYYDHGHNLFKSNELTIEENQVYCLVGCNGIGKSTVFEQMVEYGDKSLHYTATDLVARLKPFYGVFSKKDRDQLDEYYVSVNRNSRIGLNVDDFFHHDLFRNFQSTGEQLAYDIAPLINVIVEAVTSDELKGKTIYMLLDDFDVGVSIDVLQDCILILNKIVEICKKSQITFYMLIAVNSYEFAKTYRCIDVVTLNEVSFEGYDDYVDYVKKTRAFKDKREQHYQNVIDRKKDKQNNDD